MESTPTNEAWNPETHYQDSNIASSYDDMRFRNRSGQRGHQREKEAFISAIQQISSTIEIALDVPCGTGRMTQVLLDRGITTKGCDVSNEMMAQAKEKLARFEDRFTTVQGNIKELAFNDASFDLVTCVRLFGHFPTEDRIAALKELARVSKKWIIVQYFYETWLTKFKRVVKKHILHIYPGVVHPLSESVLQKEIEQANLIEEARYFTCKTYSEEVFLLLRKQ